MARFILVDDDHDILKILSALLKQTGHECVTVDNALAAMEILNNQNFDILISDATMPQFSGFDLLRTLKKNIKYNNLIKIMLTGRREADDVQQALQLGVKDYIVKPIEPMLFIEKVNKALKLIPASIANNANSPSIKTQIKWDYTIKFELIKFSEFGLGLSANLPLPNGFEFPFDQSIQIEGIQIPKTLLRVLNCEQKEQSYYINTVFVDLNETQRSNIYNALLQKTKAA